MERTVKIDEEFKALIPPLTEEEFSQLEKSIVAEGCRDPLVVWGDTLIEGHNRYEICTKHGIDYQATQREFENRDSVKAWMIDNQLGRRNLTTAQRIKLALLKEPLIAAKAKQNITRATGSRSSLTLQNSAESIETRKEVAALAGTSHDTVAKYKKIREAADEDTLRKVDSGELSINSAYVEIKKAVKKEQKHETTTRIAINNQNTYDSLDSIASSDVRFKTVYADPPWSYGNQGTRASTDNHYPTMSVEEIIALPVSQIVDDDAHLHLWTTNAFLQDAFDVMNAWGFTYKSCFVWVKPQMGMGNYWRVSHEYMLFGIRGKAKFQSRSEKSWMELPRTKHSKKPDEIRELVETVSPEPRIELFAREAHQGWSVWGNEVQHECV